MRQLSLHLPSFLCLSSVRSTCSTAIKGATSFSPKRKIAGSRESSYDDVRWWIRSLRQFLIQKVRLQQRAKSLARTWRHILAFRQSSSKIFPKILSKIFPKIFSKILTSWRAKRSAAERFSWRWLSAIIKRVVIVFSTVFEPPYERPIASIAIVEHQRTNAQITPTLHSLGDFSLAKTKTPGSLRPTGNA